MPSGNLTVLLSLLAKLQFLFLIYFIEAGYYFIKKDIPSGYVPESGKDHAPSQFYRAAQEE